MIFYVTLKTPDALGDAIDAAVSDDLRAGLIRSDKHEAEAEGLIKQTRELCKKWFRHGESVTLEIDTKLGTCEVVPCR